MSVTNLGAAFDKAERQSVDVVAPLMAAIKAELLADLRTEPPNIQVLAPSVTVQPPEVSVAAPEVSVQAPSVNVEAPSVTVQITGHEELVAATRANTKALEQIHADLAALSMILLRPVTKTINRGSGGLISDVTEAR